MGTSPQLSVRNKVLLFDSNHRRREIRAANLRMRGVDVVCAKNISEVRDFWHPDLFRLVLLEAAECPDAVTFSREVRGDCPEQKLAFFVGKPEYLSPLPVPDDEEGLGLPEAEAGVSLEEAFKSLSQKNGFVEASLRMQILRSSRRGATTVRPPADPWAKIKGFTDAD